MRGVVMNWCVVFVSLIVLGLMCGCAAEPQLLTWPEQLERLQARAHREDPEALLYACVVSETGSYSDTFAVAAEEPLTLSCQFILPDGTTFWLRYDDLDMSSTLARGRGSGYITGFDQTASQTLQRAQGALQIGPREALVVAQPHSKDFQERVGPIAMTSAILLLGEWSEEHTGLPAIWSISHYSFSKETEYINVSALDGTIVERTTVVEEDD